jgi:hypothetical protein
MKDTTLARRNGFSLAWLAVVVAPAVAAGLWWALVRGNVPGLLAVSALALLVALGAVWWLRARAARRWNAAMNVYADRELARWQRRRGRHTAA